ncbi:hypothetical protein BGZ63DRAFT_427886 [Mariannaea sp. PMI_226]|nr:hypothetical protein BGZ63DRAFT_427886 [Mariannaea sp. PMI_226]
MLGKLNLKLEHLSVSFMAEALCFFCDCDPTMEWPNLTSLCLTSELLTPDDGTDDINEMLLLEAAEAAKRMPKLETLEIWNGWEGLATLFKYESLGDEQPATITWRGT